MAGFALPLLPTATALGVGLLLGLVAERRQLDNPGMTAGLRTHTLAALAGAVTLWLGMPAFIALLLALAALSAVGYLRTGSEDPGLTSELALLTSGLLGGLAMQAPLAASALAVVVAVLVHAKSNLHRLSRELISDREIADGLMLLAFTLIVLPVLPDRPIDPHGAFNLATIWKLVVLVMAIGAAGHIAVRVVGTRWGLPVSGFFAGFVSSRPPPPPPASASRRGRNRRWRPRASARRCWPTWHRWPCSSRSCSRCRLHCCGPRAGSCSPPRWPCCCTRPPAWAVGARWRRRRRRPIRACSGSGRPWASRR